MTDLIHLPTHPTLKLGRVRSIVRPPSHPRVISLDKVKQAHPHLAARIESGPLAVFDYTDDLPADTDALVNDALGCCTAAAKGHRAQQFTSFLELPALPIDGLRQSVVQFYSETTGFDPSAALSPDGTNPTDQGGDMQSIAEFLVNRGFPMPDGTRDRFAFALQINPQNERDLAFCGLHCQNVDFGIIVTTSVMPPDGSPPPHVWTVGANDQQLGGHDVMAMARRPNGNWVVDSWGSWYEFDTAFLKANVDLAFAYVSSDMLKEGRTVMGLDLNAWEAIIQPHGVAA